MQLTKNEKAELLNIEWKDKGSVKAGNDSFYFNS